MAISKRLENISSSQGKSSILSAQLKSIFIIFFSSAIFLIYLHHPSWQQQLYGHLPPISKTLQIRRTRHAGLCWRSKDELISYVLLWTPSHGRASVGWPTRAIYNNSVRTQDVVYKTYRKRWKIGTNDEGGLGKSVPAAYEDDNKLIPNRDQSIDHCHNTEVKATKDSSIPRWPTILLHHKQRLVSRIKQSLVNRKWKKIHI